MGRRVENPLRGWEYGVGRNYMPRVYECPNKKSMADNHTHRLLVEDCFDPMMHEITKARCPVCGQTIVDVGEYDTGEPERILAHRMRVRRYHGMN